MPGGLLGVATRIIVAAMAVISCSQEEKRDRSIQESAKPSDVQVADAVASDGENRERAYSNIRRSDYVGPEVCGDCHEKNYANWKKHPHSRMNMMATDESVLGDFSGVAVLYGGRRAVFAKEGGAYVVSYFQGEKLIRKFEITRTIGWRYEQDYVGVQILGPEPPNDLLYTDETRLRFSYALERNQWLPQSYLEPTEYPGSEYKADGTLRHDPFVPQRDSFNTRCARCHNTYPYDLRFYKIYTEFGMLSGFAPGPGAEPQLVNALAREVGDLNIMRENRIPTDRFVTVGISCESCHFGGREHARKDSEIRFVPTHPLLAKWTPDHKGARKRPEVVNAICRQCHHSGASAPDNWPDGSASVNSMESIEMDRGGCRSVLKCTHCHNTHISGPDAGAPDREEHLAVCVDCHQNLQSQAAANAHSRHSSDRASCLDCHMPRIVQGFSVNNRTHRIASPTNPKILATGMPNACNLCHLDKSLAWTRDALEEGWGKRVELSQSLESQFGNAFNRPVGEAWLTHPFPLIQSVAADAYTHSPLGKKALPQLLASLNEPNAYIRLRFLQSVEKILGRRLGDQEYALTGSSKQREKQIQRLLKQY